MVLSQVKTHSSFSNVLCSNVDDCAANSFGRIETKSKVLIPLPWVKNFLSVDSPFIDGPRNSKIDKLTAKRNLEKLQHASNRMNEERKVYITKEEHHP